jgi:malate dehydrogenase (oxaloacetate-decarboxylating)(NADP+)
MNQAKSARRKQRIVFAEGEEPKIIRAAAQVADEGIGIPILVGDNKAIMENIARLGLSYKPQVIDLHGFGRLEEYTQAYYDIRKREGVTLQLAQQRIREPNVFAPMMVKMGDADAFVSGLTREYPDIIRPSLQIHHTQPGARLAAGVYIMIVGDRVYLFTDATVNIDPSAEDLADIACLAADFAVLLGLEPRVAMLSFSNFGSAPHPESQKVRQAVELVKSKRPDLVIDGEMQADTAVVPEIIDERFPFSQVKDANVLVFPNLSSANIAYKLLARLGNAQAIGPILLGMGAPVHVLQAGDDVSNIVNMAAVAVVDALYRQEAAKK